MAIEILGLLVAGAGASWGWWQLQRMRYARSVKALESVLDDDAQVAFTVAGHAMTSRGHAHLTPLHLLYGLLQDESFTAVLRSLEADPDAIETKVLAVLDGIKGDDHAAAAELVEVLNRAYTTARIGERKVSVADFGARIAYSDAGNLLGIDPYALCFRLVHDHALPPPELAGRTDVAVVLRNDNHTTFEFVVNVLQKVFELSGSDADARARETHHEGRAVIGRYKSAVAREKVIAARALARDQGFPLWIGVEDV